MNKHEEKSGFCYNYQMIRLSFVGYLKPLPALDQIDIFEGVVA